MHSILDQIKKLKAIADTGLLYSINDYDRERYTELHQVSLELMSQVSGNNTEVLKEMFALVTDYPTVKTDVRALVLSANKKQVLLARESADGKWSLPGGWADVGQSPKEVAVKEIHEETGLDVNPLALLAVFDKRMHPHPPQPFYVYKMVIYCEATSTTITKGFDVLDAAWHNIDNLPELSEDRILKSQIELVYNKVIDNDFTAYFD
ncbi:ADP-ribose pyrophosphatase [Flavobacterium rivuli WB 3.3-2 = DSM 21788]|uniref:ADP-ribose pyrophosphatase n=1 Tax=Flavobacterium rivuli WB 3.3-2 = DSM 21788 TaxID=1121895 RepID=A0A0A2MCX3_9FLAO|nr:NUDIX hydrolase [Flavobacterium rivuli]KGO86120.1 ADP-ribose pyrophosphatase [Flavobacterium rivuli WB 3.3-2 = DSM 21788]